MGEIKLRVYDIESETMTYMYDWEEIQSWKPGMFEENPVMFYTGLKDKNGVEIYEGDIFHLGDERIKYIVEWIDTGLMGRQNGNRSCVGLEHWKDRIYVIGNIYENRELLEV